MKLKILGAAFALFLASLPLISWGAWNDVDAAWYAGLGLVAVASVLPPITRFIGGEDDEKDSKQEKGERKQDKDGGGKRSEDGGNKNSNGGDGERSDKRADQRPRPGGTSPAGAPRPESERAKLQRRKADQAKERERKRE